MLPVVAVVLVDQTSGSVLTVPLKTPMGDLIVKFVVYHYEDNILDMCTNRIQRAQIAV
jgi:hypothetical protein